MINKSDIHKCKFLLSDNTELKLKFESPNESTRFLSIFARIIKPLKAN
jgi:hypothetical protein